MFSRIDHSEYALQVSSKISALSVGLWIADCAFDMLSAYLQQPYTKGISYNMFWGMEEKNFDVLLFENIYFEVIEIAMCFELDAADLCLLKAVNVANIHKVMQNQHILRYLSDYSEAELLLWHIHPKTPLMACCSFQLFTPYANVEKIRIYDHVFILHFSIHSPSMGYIEPMEFASLGLLAIAFISISSPHDEMRKLGYEALGRFKTALERCQKREGLVRLRLLLTYLQNGIEDPWQRIPSIIAMFVAEASFILLDSSPDHYLTISNFLLRSPRVNVKCIPLFETFFWSNTVKFRTLRLWILRLLYAGLNSDDDAQIYIRNNILEILLAFYASPLSDYESKELILQQLGGMMVLLVYMLIMINGQMFLGTQYLQQSYKVSGSFPFKWINKKWREGFYVTAMAIAGSRWAIVMSRGAGFSDQVQL
ncbi:hypothetical protein TEA_000719 [Camellia sinensis var. sinensis]|uniref:Uncharacterized protein n=1 Tax=Camellia sinensis var. sinensis TaxID=542762 RepID=A0A4S4DT85_CAMSN|nr:hypothetical protein TEA_000719 [Camellia sinensis var. sinensis]